MQIDDVSLIVRAMYTYIYIYTLNLGKKAHLCRCVGDACCFTHRSEAAALTAVVKSALNLRVLKGMVLTYFWVYLLDICIETVGVYLRAAIPVSEIKKINPNCGNKSC